MSVEVGYAVEVHICHCDYPVDDEKKKIFEFIEGDKIKYRCGIGLDKCPEIEKIKKKTNDILSQPKK